MEDLDIAYICSKHVPSYGLLSEDICAACQLRALRAKVAQLEERIADCQERERVRKTTQDAEQMGVDRDGG
jgi:hypothetical protein